MPQAGAALCSSPTAFAATAAMGIRAFPAKGFAMMLLSSDMNRGLKLMERQVSVSSSAASAPGPFTSAIGSVLRRRIPAHVTFFSPARGCFQEDGDGNAV